MNAELEDNSVFRSQFGSVKSTKTKDSGKLYKGLIFTGQGKYNLNEIKSKVDQIHQKKGQAKGFGGSSMRFQYPENQIPGPCYYS